MNDYQKTLFATEIAFKSLVQSSKMCGLKVQQPMGMMELPSQELTERFKNVCADIIDSIKVN